MWCLYKMGWDLIYLHSADTLFTDQHPGLNAISLHAVLCYLNEEFLPSTSFVQTDYTQ